MSAKNLAGLDGEMTKKTILLAEDDSSMRRFVEVILRQANYEVLTADDGLSALQIALETRINAVVADAIMPNLSGYDLCRMVRSNQSDEKIFCVILSGLAQNDATETADIADVFLVKNSSLKQNLLDTLSKLFA